MTARKFLYEDQTDSFFEEQGVGDELLDALLNTDPTAETGGTDYTYVPTYAANKVTLETWKRSDTTLIKSIAYTYAGNRVTTEVRKVFADNGTTILAQETISYFYTGNLLTSATMVRNV